MLVNGQHAARLGPGENDGLPLVKGLFGAGNVDDGLDIVAENGAWAGGLDMRVRTCAV